MSGAGGADARVAVGDSIRGLDALIERAYHRLGWRLPVISAAGFWLVVIAFHAMFVEEISRLTRTGGHAELVWLFRVCVGVLPAAGAGLWLSIRAARPLGAALADTSEEGSYAGIVIAQRLPFRLIAVNLVPGMVLSLPVTIWATVAAVDVGFGLLVMLALAGAGAIVLLCVSSWSWYRLVIMPMLRELSGRVPVRPRNAGPGVSSPLLASIPALGFACGVGAVIIGSSPGTPWRTIDQRLFIAVGLSLPFIVPVALLLAHASVHPLAELIHAARRLHDGDYSARVPVLPGTEFDALGATLNEAMAGLAERARLAEDNAVLLEEIRASRARIVAAGDAERRRVERNIHDGAQQRLVALALELRMIEEEAAATGAATLASMAAEAGADLKAALDDLRELARGLHPAVLASDGIGPALEQAAVRVPVPVRVVAPAERYPEVVEATVYFVACEALANVAKHARATHAEVTVRRDGSCLVLSVADDGVGGAAPGGGSGLLGLGDRLAALDGTLTIDSAPDSGTRLVARLPIVTAAPC